MSIWRIMSRNKSFRFVSLINDRLSRVSGTAISKRCDLKWALKTAMFIKKKSIGLC